MSTPMLFEALRLAERGWPVLACHTVGSGCSCRQPDCSSPGKHPRTRNGLNDATTEPARLEEWFRRWPRSNIAVHTGEESGLVVIDVDPGHGGVESMGRLVGANGRPPRGLRVRTGSGGWHLYFAHPGGTVRNSVGALGDGIDVRADGGYVIVPPSIHVSGDRYLWDSGTDDLPDLPNWLVVPEPECVGRRPWEPTHILWGLASWAEAALRREVDAVASTSVGGRNDRLNRAAFSLGQIVGAGLLTGDTVSKELLNGALNAGLGEREALRTISSGLDAGARHPRGPQSTDPRTLDPASVEVEIT